VRDLIKQSYDMARNILMSNRALMDKVTEVLVQKETVDAEELEKLIEEAMLPVAA
jgi:cell division protease FtsH